MMMHLSIILISISYAGRGVSNDMNISGNPLIWIYMIFKSGLEWVGVEMGVVIGILALRVLDNLSIESGEGIGGLVA
jgi:hypothetical protein